MGIADADNLQSGFVAGQVGYRVRYNDVLCKSTESEVRDRFQVPWVREIEYAKARGLAIRGIVLNRVSGRDRSEKTNAAEIKRLTGVRVLGIVPEVAPTRAAERLLDVFERSIDMAAIWRKRV